MKEPQQIFDYAGQRFVGPDAMLLKHALLTALLSLADEATDALKRGGIVFEEMRIVPPETPLLKKLRKKAA